MRPVRIRWKMIAIGLGILLLTLGAALVATLLLQGNGQELLRSNSLEMRVLIDVRLGLYDDRDATMPVVSLDHTILGLAQAEGRFPETMQAELFVRNESSVGLLLAEPCGDVFADEVRIGFITTEVFDLSGQSLGHICGRPMVDIKIGEPVRVEVSVHDLATDLDAPPSSALLVFEGIERRQMPAQARQAPDLAVGVPGGDSIGAPQAGRVSVYSGTGESLVHQLNGVPDEGLFGFSVDLSSDVDADGDEVPDLLIGAPFGGRTSAGRAYLYSGAEGRILLLLKGDAQLDEFGYSVSFLGDIDGDRVADLAI